MAGTSKPPVTQQPPPTEPTETTPTTTTSTQPVKAKRPPAAGGAFIRNIIKKGGKNGGPIHIEDLDEQILQKRLSKLDEELGDYKTKCSKYKKENDWYRDEIETCKRDTAEYISYLESKKTEKLEAIRWLTESNQKDFEMFTVKRKKREEENEAKIASLKNMIMDLEMKLAAKETEIMQLSDTVARRAKHESEMTKIRKEMQQAQDEHQSKMEELERSLLETRMRLQKEADAKIKSMESAAHEKASKYLSDHTSALESENRRLDRELRRLTLFTQQQIEYRDRLNAENQQLEREHKLRADLARRRLQKIHMVQDKMTESNETRRKKYAKQNKIAVSHVLDQHGLTSLGKPSRRAMAAEALVNPARTLSRVGSMNQGINAPQGYTALLQRTLSRDVMSSMSQLVPNNMMTLNNKLGDVGDGKMPMLNTPKSTPQDASGALLALHQHDDMWFEDDADDEYQ